MIPGGCGGSGYDVRTLEAYPYPHAFMREDCLQVSYKCSRSEGGKQMCGPRADEHKVIPISCMSDFINIGIDVLNTRKAELKDLYEDQSVLAYMWRGDPVLEVFYHISQLSDYCLDRFGDDQEKYLEFRKNIDVNHIGEHI